MCTRLYNPLCQSVHPSVSSLDGLLVCWSVALSGLKSALSGLESEGANFRPERPDLGLERTGFRSERANFGPEQANSRPERADFRPERVGSRSERADFRPERAWVGRMERRTYESPHCSTGLCSLWGRCPASHSNLLPCKAGQRVLLSTYCPWATCSFFLSIFLGSDPEGDKVL